MGRAEQSAWPMLAGLYSELPNIPFKVFSFRIFTWCAGILVDDGPKVGSCPEPRRGTPQKQRQLPPGGCPAAVDTVFSGNTDVIVR